MMQGNQFILLHPDDNVFVCREFCPSGTAIQLDGDVVVGTGILAGMAVVALAGDEFRLAVVVNIIPGQ